MFKLLFLVVSLVLLAIFASDNMHRVPVGLVVGQPIHMRLIFVIATAFLCGVTGGIVWCMYWRVITSKREQERAGESAEEDPHFS